MHAIKPQTPQTFLSPNEFGVCEYHLSLYRGDSFGFELLGDFDNTANFAMTIVGNTGESITPIIETVTGGIMVKISPAMTKSTVFKTGRYDLQMTVGDDVFTLLVGKVRLMGDVTA